MTGQKKPHRALSWRIEAQPDYVNDVIAFANDDLTMAGAPQRWMEHLTMHPDADWDRWRKRENYGEEQARLRSMLAVVAQPRARNRLIKRVTGGVRIFRIEGEGWINSSGHVIGEAAVKISSVQQWYSLAVAMLIHSDLTDRVRRCKLDECKRYFVDWPRRGRRMHYCSTLHQDRDNKRKHRR